jgi:hypothetical protein
MIKASGRAALDGAIAPPRSAPQPARPTRGRRRPFLEDWRMEVAIIYGWIASVFLATFVAAGKRAAAWGFLFGLLFGPLGLIASFSLDGRRRCPHCNGPVDDLPRLCPHCRLETNWPEEFFYSFMHDLGALFSSKGDRTENCKEIQPPPISQSSRK